MTMPEELPPLGPGVDLRARGLYFADEPDVDLTGCDGRGMNGIGANLRRALFVNANLVGALLCHCDLQNVNFANADLTDANFHGSDVTGAVFGGATGLDTVVCDDVLGDLPPGMGTNPKRPPSP